MVTLSRLAMPAVALAIAPFGTAMAGETLDRVLANGYMTGATADGYPPVAYLDENNELTGFDVEVAREIARRLGVDFRYVTPSWEAQVAGNWAGRWDIAVGSMTPTQARAEVLDFPGVYYYTPASFAVHADNTDIETVEDLNGKVIGACAACSYEQYLDHTLTLDIEGAPPFEFLVTPGELRTYESDGLAFDDLRLGDGVRLDAVLSNLPTLVEAINRELPLRIVGEPVFYEPLAVAVDKGDPEFSEAVAKILEEMHTDGTLSALSKTWFGVDLTKTD